MDQDALQRRLATVRQMHRDMDVAIDALVESGSSDRLRIARLKRQKLRLRDEIAMLEDHLVPDIIA